MQVRRALVQRLGGLGGWFAVVVGAKLRTNGRAEHMSEFRTLLTVCRTSVLSLCGLHHWV
jgi:hypothetical protein